MSASATTTPTRPGRSALAAIGALLALSVPPMPSVFRRVLKLRRGNKYMTGTAMNGTTFAPAQKKISTAPVVQQFTESHRQLTALGVPLKKDGNRLGLRARRDRLK